MFEGEGSFLLRVTKRGGSEWTYAGASLGMTDEDVIRRFHAIVGVGSVVIEDRTSRGFKMMWVWHVQHREDFPKFVAIVEPFLGERRRARLAEVLAATSPVRRRPPARERCVRGHLLTAKNRKPNGASKITCRECARARARA